MTPDEKLAAILAAIQADPGNRGLAKDPHDNLFTATAGDFAAACRGIAVQAEPAVDVFTGFFIPAAMPPAFETDGPLGAVFLARAFGPLDVATGIAAEVGCGTALKAGLTAAGLDDVTVTSWDPDPSPAGSRKDRMVNCVPRTAGPLRRRTHYLALERVGPASDGRCYTMRGRDVSDHTAPVEVLFPQTRHGRVRTIGIGDGGNEIGMGRISHETIVKNIPNGDLIHCCFATDHLIVAGVSNWGAYALAAGIYVLRGIKPPPDLFDPDREKQILEVMVREGPLVDGKTGKQEATVDGLTWDEYVKPLVRIREILKWT
jgi:hypothetical protein